MILATNVAPLVEKQCVKRQGLPRRRVKRVLQQWCVGNLLEKEKNHLLFKKIKYRMIAPKRRDLSESNKQIIITTEGRSALLMDAQIKLSMEDFARGMVQREHNAVVKGVQM